jgi:hypothetical protein
MAERLNNIAYAEYLTASHQESLINGTNFNPRSVSFDVRTPEELAAVNEFLVTLGRDVAAGGAHRQPLSSDGLPYFDAASLNQLGLWGMPGVPTSGSGFPSEQMYTSAPGIDSLPAPLHSMARSTHPSAQPSLYGNTYSPGNDPGASFSPADFSFQRRHSSKFPSMSNVSGSLHHHRPTPPLDAGSPHSSASSPANSTPPHHSLSGSDTSSFDYLRASNGEAPAPQLVPVDYMDKSRRTILPLKTAPGDPPEPVEPKLTHGIHRGPPAKLTPSAVSLLSLSSSKSSLYPLLTSGDVQYKLPPLKDTYPPSSPVAVAPSSPGSTHDTTSRSTSDQPKYNLPPLSHMYRSPSPVGSPQSQSSRSSSPSSTLGSPVTQPRVLPSLRSITTLGGGRPSESDELSQKIGQIELENRTKEISHEERKQHSELILNLLVQINKDFKRKYGTLSPVTVMPANRKLLFSDGPRDVEMTLG